MRDSPHKSFFDSPTASRPFPNSLSVLPSSTFLPFAEYGPASSILFLTWATFTLAGLPELGQSDLTAATPPPTPTPPPHPQMMLILAAREIQYGAPLNGGFKKSFQGGGCGGVGRMVYFDTHRASRKVGLIIIGRH